MLDELLRRQDGVVSRQQLHALGLAAHDVRRLLRRRELAPVWAGVYVTHTGEPSWSQRAWAAVLACQRSTGTGSMPDAESAALHGVSALRCHDGDRDRPSAPLLVAVKDERRPRPPREVAVLRSSSTLEHVQWHLGPPRVRYEHAVVEVASRQTRVVDMVAELSKAVGSRRTTAHRLLLSTTSAPRIPRRELLVAVLQDLTEGACSVLEHGYLTRVERAHGHPTAARQVRGRSRTSLTYRDADYDGLVVELDGRAWHDSTGQRDRDADRDLVAAVEGSTTVRLTWGQAFDRACWTAGQLARLLGVPVRRCGSSCTVQWTS